MLQFNQKLTTLALLAVASVSGTIFAVSNVSAQQKPASAEKDVILWSNPSSSGRSFESNVGVADLSKVGFDNKTSFIQVTNGQKWRFYKDKNFQGPFVEIGPDEARGGLGNLDKQISSFRAVK
jgi:hypothetical protein